MLGMVSAERVSSCQILMLYKKDNHFDERHDQNIFKLLNVNIYGSTNAKAETN